MSNKKAQNTNKKETKIDPFNPENLRAFIHDTNELQMIRNEHLINNLLLTEANKNSRSDKKSTVPKFLVILIQIHSRFTYLKELIMSLKNTRHIEDTLVIFSHDVYNEEMNDLIKNIKFCATLQIFYPYSLQVYRDRFPGMDPNDCGKSLTKDQAIKANCNNKYHPDTYGHYREHKIVQIKHHWFWKIGFVFEKLKETKNLENLQVLFLEEDHYLMPDSIFVLRKLSEKILTDIDVVSLALMQNLEPNLEFTKAHLYKKAVWHTSMHNTGLVLGRAQWNMLKNCVNAFCTYDDYNWDWTLQHMSHNYFKLPLVSIHPSSSRVIHIGQCGTHYTGKNCDPKESVQNLMKIFSMKKDLFFPNDLLLERADTQINRSRMPNGGWSDPRDHQLCKQFVTSNNDFANLVNITITL